MDFVLAEIGRFYEDSNKFWTEEIHHVAEALKKGRTDPRDRECWKIFRSSLKQTIESWKVGFLTFYMHSAADYNKLPSSGSANKRLF